MHLKCDKNCNDIRIDMQHLLAGCVFIMKYVFIMCIYNKDAVIYVLINLKKCQPLLKLMRSSNQVMSFG